MPVLGKPGIATLKLQANKSAGIAGAKYQANARGTNGKFVDVELTPRETQLPSKADDPGVKDPEAFLCIVNGQGIFGYIALMVDWMKVLRFSTIESGSVQSRR